MTNQILGFFLSYKFLKFLLFDYRKGVKYYFLSFMCNQCFTAIFRRYSKFFERLSSTNWFCRTYSTCIQCEYTRYTNAFRRFGTSHDFLRLKGELQMINVNVDLFSRRMKNGHVFKIIVRGNCLKRKY